MGTKISQRKHLIKMNEQQQKAIEYLTAIGKRKIEFNPKIKIKNSPHSYPLWIDDVEKLKENYVVTISNKENTTYRKGLLTLEPEFLNSLVIRLFSMQPKP